jgi:hypothetical protein
LGPVELDRSPGSADRRGVVGICVGRDRDTRGSVLVYAIDSGKLLVRSHVRQVELTKDIIERVNARAALVQPLPTTEIILMGGRAIVPDDPSPQGELSSLG